MYIKNTVVTVLVFIKAALGNTQYQLNKCMDAKPTSHLVGVALNDCIRSCARSDRCSGISYMRSHKLCSQYTSISSLTSCAGTLTVFKTDFPSEAFVTDQEDNQVPDCAKLPEVENAITYGNMIQVGSKVKVKCMHNEEVHYITCKPDGQWSSLPTCPTDCGPPPIVANAVPSFSTTLQGSVTKYTCKSGYIGTVPNTYMTLTCQSSGQWSSPSFFCQVTCNAPPDVAHARKTSPIPIAGRNVFQVNLKSDLGSSVTYTCLSGYIASPTDANMTITCLNNGLWEYINFSCEVITVGDKCTSDNDCEIIDARCVNTDIDAAGKCCYCKRLFEYSNTSKTCVQVCTTYDDLQLYTGKYIFRHNAGDSNNSSLTLTQCQQLCQLTFPASLSFDHMPNKLNGTNCYCNEVTYQQVMDGNQKYIRKDVDYNLYSWTCKNKYIK